MIFDNKIFPSFYIIKIDGAAIGSVIPSDFNIESISVASKEFLTDIEATIAAEKTIDAILEDLGAQDAYESRVELNPQFFPVGGGTENNQEDDEEEDDVPLQLGKKVVPILTKKFDELGDFVESRTTVRGDSFTIVSKIAVDPQQYIIEKTAVIKNKNLGSIVDSIKGSSSVRIH